MMNIKQMGDYLEIECCGCGESLLIGDGDSVNVRVGTATDMDGEEIPMPEGFLCSVCHKEEGSLDNFVRIQKKKCSSCGKACESEEEDRNFFPKFDSENNFTGFFCGDCF